MCSRYCQLRAVFLIMYHHDILSWCQFPVKQIVQTMLIFFFFLFCHQVIIPQVPKTFCGDIQDRMSQICMLRAFVCLYVCVFVCLCVCLFVCFSKIRTYWKIWEHYSLRSSKRLLIKIKVTLSRLLPVLYIFEIYQGPIWLISYKFRACLHFTKESVSSILPIWFVWH